MPEVAIAFGVLAVLFNSYFNHLFTDQMKGLAELNAVNTAVVFSNLLSWALVGATLALRIMISTRLYPHRKKAVIDLSNIAALQP